MATLNIVSFDIFQLNHEMKRSPCRTLAQLETVPSAWLELACLPRGTRRIGLIAGRERQTQKVGLTAPSVHSNRDGEQFRADLESCPLGGGQRYLEPNALIHGHEVEHRAHIETPLIGRHQQRGAISGGSERTQESGMPRT